MSLTLRSIAPSKQPPRKPLPRGRKPAPKQEVDVVASVSSDVDGEPAGDSLISKVKSKDIQGLKYVDILLPQFNDIVRNQNSYVCGLRDNSVYETIEPRELSQATVDAGVLSDEVISMGKSGNRPDHKILLFCVKCTLYTIRGKSKLGSTGGESDGILRIETNLLEMPAEIISLIYSQRWIIEIFLRLLKQFLGCSHLISHSQNGIEIQTYCATSLNY